MSTNRVLFRKYKEKISKFIFGNSIYILIFLIIFSVFSRFLLIGEESLWLDEAWSIDFARNTKFPNIINYFVDENWADPHPFFYFFILNIWITFFGTTEVALRSLSAVFGILIILLVYYIGSKEFNKKIGLISSFFVILSPLNLYYSQETRMYTLTSLLILISVYYNYKLNTSNKPIKYGFLYSFFTLVLLYTDYLGFIVIGLNLLFTIFLIINKLKRKKIVKRHLFIIFISYLLIIMFYLPWIHNILYIYQIGSTAWMVSPDMNDAIEGFSKIFGIVAENYFNEIFFMIPNKKFFLFLCSFLIIVILISSIIAIYLDNRKIYNFKLLILFISSTPVLIFVISIYITPIYHLRQISVYIPEIAFLFSIGLFYFPTLLQRFFNRKRKTFPLKNKISNILFYIPTLLRRFFSKKRKTIPRKNKILQILFYIPTLLQRFFSKKRKTVYRRNKILKILIILGAIFVFTINSINIYGYYIIDTKEDWRGAVNYIHGKTNQTDIIFLHARFIIKPFNYYYQENATVLGIDNYSQIEPYIPFYDKIWVIFSHSRSRAENDIKNYMISVTNISTSKTFRLIEIMEYRF